MLSIGLQPSLSDLTGDNDESITNLLNKGTSRLSSGVSPATVSSGVSAEKGVNTTALAGAGIALGLAGVGGGLYLSSRNSYYTFTPEDWDNTDTETQNVIIEDFKNAGLTDLDIEEFKTLSFKVPSSVINDSIKKIKKAYSADESVVDNFFEMYHFSIFDYDDDIDPYLLFIVMIIDGENDHEEVNLYNIINPFIDDDDVDFVYSGVKLREYSYIDDDIDETEIVEINDDEE